MFIISFLFKRKYSKYTPDCLHSLRNLSSLYVAFIWSSVFGKYVKVKECKHRKQVCKGGSRKSSGYESNHTCNADTTVLK